jgi:hypothetical protein
MNYEITKLDNRHSWHEQFDYMIEFKKSRAYLVNTNTGVLEFDRSRKWFNEKFGWSQDVETRAAIIRSAPLGELLDSFNKHWAYSIKYNDYRIYVNDDATLNWFVLSHPRTEHAQY